jgi:hypothetical protein
MTLKQIHPSVIVVCFKQSLWNDLFVLVVCMCLKWKWKCAVRHPRGSRLEQSHTIHYRLSGRLLVSLDTALFCSLPHEISANVPCDEKRSVLWVSCTEEEVGRESPLPIKSVERVACVKLGSSVWRSCTEKGAIEITNSMLSCNGVQMGLVSSSFYVAIDISDCVVSNGKMIGG